jgi:hypothetical protein
MNDDSFQEHEFFFNDVGRAIGHGQYLLKDVFIDFLWVFTVTKLRDYVEISGGLFFLGGSGLLDYKQD